VISLYEKCFREFTAMKNFISLVAVSMLLVSCGKDDNNQISQAELQNQNAVNPALNGVGVTPFNNGQIGGNWGSWNNWGQQGWQRNNMGAFRWGGGNFYNPQQGWNYSRRNTIPRRVPRGCFYTDTSNPNVQNFKWPANCPTDFVQNFHASNQALDQVYNCNTVDELAQNITPVVQNLENFQRSYPNTYCTHTQNKGGSTLKGTLSSTHLTTSLRALKIYQSRISNSLANECTSDVRVKLMTFSNQVRDLDIERKFKKTICRRVELASEIENYIMANKDNPTCYVTRFVKVGNTKKLEQQSVSIEGLYNLKTRVMGRIKTKRKYRRRASNCPHYSDTL
jgi:hypothetical protein